MKKSKNTLKFMYEACIASHCASTISKAIQYKSSNASSSSVVQCNENYKHLKG